MICEKCGTKMEWCKDGHLITWICTNCGDAVATSFFEQFEIDTTVYHIFIVPIAKVTVKELKVIAEVANCNYIEAKQKLETAPNEIFHGNALEIMSIRKKLQESNLAFTITPDFPY